MWHLHSETSPQFNRPVELLRHRHGAVEHTLVFENPWAAHEIGNPPRERPIAQFSTFTHLRYQTADPVRLGCFCGPADSLCVSLEMLLIASSLPRIAVCIFFTDTLQGACNLLSDLLLQRHQACCGGHTCLLLGYATAAATAAADLEGLQLTPLAMALISAPLPCQMEACFSTQLEPTRMR